MATRAAVAVASSGLTDRTRSYERKARSLAPILSVSTRAVRNDRSILMPASVARSAAVDKTSALPSQSFCYAHGSAGEQLGGELGPLVQERESRGARRRAGLLAEARIQRRPRAPLGVELLQLRDRLFVTGCGSEERLVRLGRVLHVAELLHPATC